MKVVGIGGTTRPNSSSERILRFCLKYVEELGGEALTFAAADLLMPHYAPERPERAPEAVRLVEALRGASGVVICSPGYHGGVSGLVKNAIDYAEDLREDDPPYLQHRAVGCITCAAGWQATTTTLTSLRSVVHALRGWPTPLGVAVNTAEPIWDDAGQLRSDPVREQLQILARQVVEFPALRA